MSTAEFSTTQFALVPTAAPLSYPGRSPDTSSLLMGDTVLTLQPRAGRRVPQWRVVLGGATLPNEHRAADTLPLNFVLLRHNQTPMGDRIPVLAVGSNASPAQLLDKLVTRSVSPVLPMGLATEVHGLAIGVSAHVSNPGYVPTTPITAPGAVSSLFILWPDSTQLAVLDETEPNYHRVLLPAKKFPVVLPSGEHLSHCYAFVSRHGHLLDAAGQPMLMPQALPANGWTSPQPGLLRALLDRDGELRDLLGPDPATFIDRARQAPAVRDAVRDLFQARGWVARSPRLDELITASGDGGVARPRAMTYDEKPPVHPISAGAMRVLRSSDDFDRHGQPAVRVAPDVAKRLERRHVLVSPAGEGGSLNGALAKLVVHSGLSDQSALEVDQLIRNSIGVEIGEDVVLTPVRVRRNRVFDLVVGRPSYVLCRVQAADLASVEQEVCLLDELTLGLLGVQSGDEIVVEGGAGPDGVIRQVRVKALKTSEVVQQRRESLHGGDLSCRFPSARDALAVHPDLPWIFLDSTTRAVLGFDGQKLTTVRLRPSRRYQLRKELREMLLLIGLAFIGLVSIFDGRQAQLITLASLLLFVAAVVGMRMRGRLTHELHTTRRQPRAARRHHS